MTIDGTPESQEQPRESAADKKTGYTVTCQATLKDVAAQRLEAYCSLAGVSKGTIASDLTRRFALSPEVTSLLKSHGVPLEPMSDVESL